MDSKWQESVGSGGIYGDSVSFLRAEIDRLTANLEESLRCGNEFVHEAEERIEALTNQLTAKEVEIGNLKNDNHFLEHELAATAEELDNLRRGRDEIFGIGTPHLDGLTETQLERYSQLSPPEIYRLLLAREAELDRLREAGPQWEPVGDSVYGDHDTIEVQRDGEILYIVSAYGNGQVGHAMIPLSSDMRLCRRTQAGGQDGE